MAQKLERYAVSLGSNSLTLPTGANVQGLIKDGANWYVVCNYDDALGGTEARTIVACDNSNITVVSPLLFAANARVVYEKHTDSGAQGAPGSTGSTGPAVFLTLQEGDEGPPGQSIQGPPGQSIQGAKGDTGPAIFIEAEPGEDGMIVPLVSAGPRDTQVVAGPAIFLEAEPGEDGMMIGSSGQSTQVTQVVAGPAIFLDAEPGEDGMPGPPGSQGLQGPAGSSTDLALSKKAPASNVTITAGYSAYVVDEYECVSGIETEIGIDATLEIG